MCKVNTLHSTAQGTRPVFHNYDWSVTFKSGEPLLCLWNLKKLYINYTSNKKNFRPVINDKPRIEADIVMVNITKPFNGITVISNLIQHWQNPPQQFQIGK